MVGMVAAELTKSQHARQERMLDVASTLAAEGGYDAVQMRAVASGADVALGTLYRYFPSKEHLLVSVMLRQIGALSERLTVRPALGATPGERVSEVLGRATTALLRQAQFTNAVMRALVAGEASVAPVVRQVRESMNAIVLAAINGGDHLGDQIPDHDLLVADLLGEVWFSALVGWISGVNPATSIMRKLDAAIALLL